MNRMKSFILCLGLVLGSQLQASEQPGLLNRVFSHPTFTKALRCTNKALIFAPSAMAIAGIVIMNNIQRDMEKQDSMHFERNQDSSKDFEKCKTIFINELKHQEIPINDESQIKINTWPLGTSVGHDRLHLGQELFDKEKKYYKYNENGVIIGAKYPLISDAALTGIIGHEVGHLKHNDFVKGYLLGAALPFGVLATQKALLSRIKSPAVKNLAMLPLAGGLSWLSLKIAFPYYSRQRERAADECVKNDPQVLEAMAAINDTWSKHDPKTVLEKLTSTHPSSADRAKRFRERAVQLQAQK